MVIFSESNIQTSKQRVCNYISTTGATSGARTAYSSGELEFTPGF